MINYKYYKTFFYEAHTFTFLFIYFSHNIHLFKYIINILKILFICFYEAINITL